MIVAVEVLAAKAAQAESSTPAARRRLPAGQRSMEVLLKLMGVLGPWLQSYGAQEKSDSLSDAQTAAAKCFVDVTASLAVGADERIAKTARRLLGAYGKRLSPSGTNAVINAMLNRTGHTYEELSSFQQKKRTYLSPDILIITTAVLS